MPCRTSQAFKALCCACILGFCAVVNTYRFLQIKHCLPKLKEDKISCITQLNALRNKGLTFKGAVVRMFYAVDHMVPDCAIPSAPLTSVVPKTRQLFEQANDPTSPVYLKRLNKDFNHKPVVLNLENCEGVSCKLCCRHCVGKAAENDKESQEALSKKLQHPREGFYTTTAVGCEVCGVALCCDIARYP